MNFPLAVCIVPALVFQCWSAAFAQDSTRSAPFARDQVLKPEDLLSDLQILRAAYEQLHPGLYRYNSKVEMDANFDQLRAQFSHDRSLQEAYIAFSVFAAKVKCRHTYPNFFNQKREIASALLEGEDRVPFYFRWLDNRMVVTADFTPSHALPRGTQILSINGTPTNIILARLITIARADGSDDAKRVASLEVSGDSQYEAFDVYFPMFFPQTRSAMQLSVQRPSEKKSQSLTVAPPLHGCNEIQASRWRI